MFAKLLKYEWKSNVGLLGLLSGCALGLGCVSAVVLRLLTANWDMIIAKDTNILFLIPAMLFLFAAYIGIILYASSVQYILLFRFYKSRFTDEGYLMFTLPVKTSHLFLSSALNILIWNVISFLVIAASVTIAVVLGPVWQPEVIEEIKLVFSEMGYLYTEIIGPGYWVALPLAAIILWMYGIVAPMSAVVLGSSIAKKHKVLAIIGILIALSAVTSTANGIISAVVQIATITAANTDAFFSLTPLASCIVPLIMTIGGYILSIHMMKNKLNLP